MSKKGKTIIAAVAAIFLIIVIVVVILKKPDSNNEPANNGGGSSVVGTWYSDKPDMLTFAEDGTYQAAAWNGGNAWLSSGAYSVEGNTLTLTGSFDGTTILTIGQNEITGKYTYFRQRHGAGGKFIL